ncbi:MAG: ADP-ribosylglycohydrolase family protein [Bacilli bacterium]
MIGAIVGDIVGSIYEWDNKKSKEFKFLTKENFFTDDTVMTLAIAKALLHLDKDLKSWQKLLINEMRNIGLKHPASGYGRGFMLWLLSKNPKPYHSYGNGAGMRISPVAYVGYTLDEVTFLSRIVTEVTHDHPEGIKAAEAIAVATFMARKKFTKIQIKKHLQKYYYPLNFTLHEIRPTYSFDETAQGSTPQAIVAFLESNDFEDAIRNAISIGGDSDTIAAMTGAIAGAFYGIPKPIEEKTLSYLTKDLLDIVVAFKQKYRNF